MSSTPQPRWPWAAVLALAVSVFAVTATEMMPIGLLTEMASDLGASEAAIGLSVTIYGVLAGLLAPLWIPLTRRVDRRTLVAGVVGVFTLGNYATSLSTTYTQLLLARLTVGVFHGLMWAIIAGVAIRMVPPASTARATAITFSGISLALVLGVPVGSFIGEHLGWRSAFVILSAIAAVAGVAVLIVVPRVPSQTQMCAKDVPALLARGGLRKILAVTGLVVVANYSAYTYISPFLTDTVGVDRSELGTYLLTYGIAGVVGNLAAGSLLARAATTQSRTRLLLVGTSLMTVALAMALLPIGPTPTLGLLALWGLTYSALPVVLQTIIFTVAPSAKDTATSLYVLVFNVSIAAGAGLGALAIATSTPAAPLACAVALGAGGCVAITISRSSRADSEQVAHL